MELAYTIVHKIADLEGTDPKDLPALFDTIDTETLEKLIDSANEVAVNVRFTYFGYNINVNGDREVKVRKNDIE